MSLSVFVSRSALISKVLNSDAFWHAMKMQRAPKVSGPKITSLMDVDTQIEPVSRYVEGYHIVMSCLWTFRISFWKIFFINSAAKEYFCKVAVPVLWDTQPSCPYVNRRYGGIYDLHLQSRKSSEHEPADYSVWLLGHSVKFCMWICFRFAA
jgi:hypothetical protein